MKIIQFVVASMATVVMAAGAFAPSLSAQGSPASKKLTVDLAQTMVQEAIATCRANGYHVTATVVDSGNFVKALLRDDGAMPGTVDGAKMKAYTVIIGGGTPSGPPANLPAGAPVPPAELPGTVNGMGGIPIKVGDELIGAVAVSGGPGGDKDLACANAALAKVADKLK